MLEDPAKPVLRLDRVHGRSPAVAPPLMGFYVCNSHFYFESSQERGLETVGECARGVCTSESSGDSGFARWTVSRGLSDAALLQTCLYPTGFCGSTSASTTVLGISV